MKKVLLVLIAFSFVFAFVTPSHADVGAKVEHAIHGLVDVLKSPLKLLDHTKATLDESDNKLTGFIKGAVESPFHMLKQIMEGVTDVVSAPIHTE